MRTDFRNEPWCQTLHEQSTLKMNSVRFASILKLNASNYEMKNRPSQNMISRSRSTVTKILQKISCNIWHSYNMPGSIAAFFSKTTLSSRFKLPQNFAHLPELYNRKSVPRVFKKVCRSSECWGCGQDGHFVIAPKSTSAFENLTLLDTLYLLQYWFSIFSKKNPLLRIFRPKKKFRWIGNIFDRDWDTEQNWQCRNGFLACKLDRFMGFILGQQSHVILFPDTSPQLPSALHECEIFLRLM